MGREAYRSRWRHRGHGVAPLMTTAALVALMAPLGCEREPAAPSSVASARSVDESVRAVEQYLAQGRMREARVISARLVEVEPGNATVREVHARVLLSEALVDHPEGRARDAALGEAAEAYLVALSLDRENAALHHAAGVALDQSGRSTESLELYNRACLLDPTQAQYELYAAMALRRLMRLDEARARLDRAAMLSPDEPLVAILRSDVALASDRPSEALEEAQRARRLAPGELAARIAESRALRALGRHAECAEMLLALPRASRTNEAIASELAEALLVIERPKAAALAWEEALSVDSRRWRSAVGAGHAWISAGDLIRAETFLRHAQGVAPGEPPVEALEERLRAALESGASPVPSGHPSPRDSAQAKEASQRAPGSPRGSE
ncbi:MAG: hypothetical protein KF724_04750 [Phycisphaeraceae bacterium]|nr:hypothetical protein [Phycisphaeraceae bacterium]